MAEGEQVGELGRRVDVTDPGVFFPCYVRAAAVRGHAHDLAERIGDHVLAEADVAMQQIHFELV